MTTQTAPNQRWRIAGWGALAALLVVPAVAMRYTTEVGWTPLDFVAAAVLLGLLGLGVELAMRVRGGGFARIGMALATLTAFLLIWVNLAVGIIGSENNDANLMFAGVLAVAAGGAALTRLGPAGMARAMATTAAAQVLVGLVALVGRLGVEGAAWPLDVIGATGLFATLWLLAAASFHYATRN